MECLKIAPDHAPLIAELEKKLYPPAFCLGEAAIRKNLLRADRFRENLSWGFFQGERLLGYLLAWVEESLVEEFSGEEVIFVDDVLILPEHRIGLLRLFRALKQEIEELGLGRLAVEGTTRKSAHQIFAAHEPFFEELGYELVARSRYHDPDLGEELIWVRFQPG